MSEGFGAASTPQFARPRCGLRPMGGSPKRRNAYGTVNPGIGGLSGTRFARRGRSPLIGALVALEPHAPFSPRSGGRVGNRAASRW